MCVLSFEDGMTAESWYAWLAFRRRVSMSAIGSVIVMACVASLAAVPHVSRVLRWSWAYRRTVELWFGRGECPGRVERLDRPRYRVPRRACEAWGVAGSFTSWTCARPAAPRREPSPAGRSGRGRTCGRRSGDDRTA